MKGAGAAFAILLCTLILCSQVFSGPHGPDTPKMCCFSYVGRQMARKVIADFFETNSLCSKPGIVFKTKRGQNVCANPSEPWVQQYTAELRQKAEAGAVEFQRAQRADGSRGPRLGSSSETPTATSPGS